jgi:NAD(P)-dependent dehydrogenase (short-subunit alcohol dehydrogenase family)
MGRSVLVTGTSTGLGLETAIYLARRGLDVYASMRDLGRRAELDAAAARHGVRLHVLQLDVTDPASVQRAVGQVASAPDGIYALVNNAGIGLRGYFEDLLDEEIRQVFEANVFGTMNVTRAVLPHMRRARRGRIVVVGSVGGRIAAFGVSAYCATKFAQEGFAEALAQELTPLGIHVSLVEPGIVRTARWGTNRNVGRQALDPASPYAPWFREAERLADRLGAAAPATPADVAKAVYRALTDGRPRLRYVVGWRPALVIALRRLLPDRLFERLYFGTAVRRVTQAAGQLPVADTARPVAGAR